MLASLTQPQWKQLGKAGLGLADLDDEQRQIYQSLLPNPFKIRRPRKDENGGLHGIDIITLALPEREQVRLRVQRTINGTLPSVSNRGSYPGHLYACTLSKDEPILTRERDEREYAASEGDYGAPSVSVVPNKPKAGDIDYVARTWDSVVSLDQANSIKECLARVELATGLEFHADARVSQLTVDARGGNVRGGDLLQALALAVTGAWRKIDTAYLLGPDLSGVGAQWIRWCAWRSDAVYAPNTKAAKLDLAMETELINGDGLKNIDWPDEYSYIPSPEMLETMSTQYPVSFDKLTPSIQKDVLESVQKHNAEHPNDMVNGDKVMLSENISIVFQLPDGAMLDSEDSIDCTPRSKDILPPSPPADETVKTKVTQIAGPVTWPSWARQRMLMLRADTPEEAKRVVAEAVQIGATDLVMRTESPQVLRIAISEAHVHKGMRVLAGIAPFTAEGVNQRFVDRNITGLSADEVRASRRNSPDWPEFIKCYMSDLPLGIPEDMLGADTLVEQVGKGLNDRIHKINSLAEVEGLAACVLFDTCPSGYKERRISNLGSQLSSFGRDNYLMCLGDFGYTPAMRLALIRQTGRDPIDVFPEGLSGYPTIYLPFFPIEMSASSLAGYTDKACGPWQKLRSEVNKAAMIQIYNSIKKTKPSLRLYIDTKRQPDIPTVSDEYAYVPWQMPNIFPGYRDYSSEYKMLRFTEAGTDEDNMRVWRCLERMHSSAAKDQPNPLTLQLDFGEITADKALKMLNLHFVSVASPPDIHSVRPTAKPYASPYPINVSRLSVLTPR